MGCIKGIKPDHCSTGFSNQGFLWSRILIFDFALLFYIYCSLIAKSSLTLLRPHRLYPTRLLCPWDFPSKTTGVGCCCLLQEIQPTSPASAGVFFTTEPLGKVYIFVNCLNFILNKCRCTCLSLQHHCWVVCPPEGQGLARRQWRAGRKRNRLASLGCLGRQRMLSPFQGIRGISERFWAGKWQVRHQVSNPGSSYGVVGLQVAGGAPLLQMHSNHHLATCENAASRSGLRWAQGLHF